MELINKIYSAISSPQKLGCSIALLFFCNVVFTQDNRKPYFIKDGKMNVYLNKKKSEKFIDSIARQFGLQDLMLKEFLKNNFNDSLIKKGWKVEENDEGACLLTKPFFAFDGVNNPINRIEISSDVFKAANNEVIVSNCGINLFKANKEFDVNDSVVVFKLDGFENATNVFLAGSFTNWQFNKIAMIKDIKGWQVAVKLTSGKHFYKFIVDDIWMTDRNNKNVENDDKGNQNSVYFKTNHTFTLNNFAHARKVFLAGNFSNWEENKLSLKKVGANWCLPIFLPKGTYTYKFIVDGNWMPDPGNKQTFPNEFSEYNSVLQIGKPYRFFIDGFSNAQKVVLAGSFNGWKTYELPMKKIGNGWEFFYVLSDGNYEYKFFIDGKPFNKDGTPLMSDVNASALVVNPNYTFKLSGFEAAKNIFISGDFNGWSKQGFPMKKEGNYWTIDLHLQKGKHLYKYIVDDKWIIDPNNKLWEENEYGTGNSILWIE